MLTRLWRRRQWRLLLSLVDGRSAYTHLSHAISQDEDYWRQHVSKFGNTAQAAGKQTPPPLSEWSQPAALLAELIEEVRSLRIVTVAINSKKGARKPEFTRVLRPISVLSKVLREQRYANHYKLRDRVLPHLRGQKPPEEPEPMTAKGTKKRWSSSSPSTRRRR